MDEEIQEEIQIKVYRRSDGMWYADTDDSRHASGVTRFLVLINLASCLDKTESYAAWHKRVNKASS